MKIILALIVAVTALVAAPAQACVHSVESNSEYVQICASSDLCKTIFLADLVGKTEAQREEEIRQTFQDFLDFREPLTQLVLDEEIRGVNPDCENFYWSDSEGKVVADSVATSYVARDCVVDAVQWDKTLQLFLMTIRRADRCQ